jgi:K+-transporting ATPase ATPase C chain
MLGLRSAGRQFTTALRALLVATVALGIGYPLVITGVSQVTMSGHANGSLVDVTDVPVGSALIGQSFADADGNALPQYFQGRPSAVGYDAGSSGGSNLGPENPDLVSTIGDRIAAVAASDGVAPSEVPADAVTASASGLDPHISPEYAREQVERVAAARDLEPSVVRHIVDENTEGRMLGFLGNPTVNVLKVNIALDALSG